MAKSTVTKILGETYIRPPTNAEMTYADDALRYAVDVAKKPCALVEPAIAKRAQASYEYANRFNRRFPLGEPAIARSAEWSMWYAYNILATPFPEGEDAIFTDQSMSGDVIRSCYIKMLKEWGIDLATHFTERIASGELNLQDLYFYDDEYTR
jgi:hypothetical protein